MTSDAARPSFLSAFDHILDPVYVADPETHELLYANKKFRELWGVVEGKPCYAVLQGLASPCSFCTNPRIFGENLGRPYTWEFQNLVNNHWYRCIDVAIQWPDGRWVRFEIAVDLSNSDTAERLVRESELRYRGLEESSSNAVMLLDEHGFLDCNDATLRLFGYADRQEFFCKHPSDLSPPRQPDGSDSRRAADEKIALAYREGCARFEWVHRRANGTDFAAEVLLNAITLNGRPVIQA
ncbi:MAG: PAS domain-containing protein, partial [Candidatus Eisenbacteria bacterium]|nr:PAS domain-containing protein [Candidatus Eisenbacteria bacterium]